MLQFVKANTCMGGSGKNQPSSLCKSTVIDRQYLNRNAASTKYVGFSVYTHYGTCMKTHILCGCSIPIIILKQILSIYLSKCNDSTVDPIVCIHTIGPQYRQCIIHAADGEVPYTAHTCIQAIYMCVPFYDSTTSVDQHAIASGIAVTRSHGGGVINWFMLRCDLGPKQNLSSDGPLCTPR